MQCMGEAFENKAVRSMGEEEGGGAFLWALEFRVQLLQLRRRSREYWVERTDAEPGGI